MSHNLVTRQKSGTGVLDMLKKKLATAKEDAEKYQTECENVKAKLATESTRADEAEEQVNSLNRRIHLLEDSVRCKDKLSF